MLRTTGVWTCVYRHAAVHTCSCSSARRFALSSSESELGLLSLSSLSLLSSLSEEDEEDEEDEEELGGAGGSSGILAIQNSKTSWREKMVWFKKKCNWKWEVEVSNCENLKVPINFFNHWNKENHLEFSGHGHHIVVRRVVLVAVGEHQSNISGELVRLTVLSAVHLSLKQQKKRF